MVNSIKILWNLFLYQYKLKKEFLTGQGIFYSSWEYKFLNLDEDKRLIKYIDEQARKLAESEGIPIYDNIPIELLNEKETDRKKWAVGLFIYRKDKDNTKVIESINEYNELIQSYDDALNQYKNKISEKIYTEYKSKYVDKKKDIQKRIEKLQIPVPRIELTKENDNISEVDIILTLIHELGHYFIYKNGGEQSEEKADLYIEEFFDNYLPPFFKWVFQIIIGIRTQKELKFLNEESFQYWKDYTFFNSENKKHSK